MSGRRKPVGKPAKQVPGQSRMLWYGVGAAIVLFAAIAFFVSRGASIPFEMTGGDDNPLVLLRDETTVYYELTYTGSAPAVLERVIPRIQLYQGQVLVADVQAILVTVGGEDLRLKDGRFPEGQGLDLQQGDSFQVGVILLGQELGWNRIYGWRIQYSTEGRSIDSVLELEDNYYIFVE